MHARTAPSDAAAPLRLHGVDHTARPTWRLKETVTFYRDILGLPLIHTISARGWGPSTHPDFLHFFFDSGKGFRCAYSSQCLYCAVANNKFPIPVQHID